MNYANIFKPVFIIGTGRCGTTIMGKVLSRHPYVYFAPKEFHLLVNPDGLLSLKRALVDDWSPFNATVAIERFNQMIINFSRHFGHYTSSLTYRQILGKKNWDTKTKKFLDKLISFKYKGSWGGNSNIIGKSLIHFFGLRKLNPFLGKIYYHGPLSKERFFQITREFIIRLFSNRMKKLNKKIWVDHSPQICMHADFVIDMFPEAKFLYLYRDPRDVICSYRTRDWAPDKIIEAATIVRDILLRWEKVKQSISKESYVEIRFEDLILNTSRVLEQICSWLGIQLTEEMKKIDLSRNNIGRWQKELTQRDLAILGEKFPELLNTYG